MAEGFAYHVWKLYIGVFLVDFGDDTLGISVPLLLPKVSSVFKSVYSLSMVLINSEFM